MRSLDLPRAIRSGGMQILHTVLCWGDARGYEWQWDRLHPVKMADGGSVDVSALHLAASMDDGGCVDATRCLSWSIIAIFTYIYSLRMCIFEACRYVAKASTLLPCACSYAAELLLIKYASARRYWRTLEDSLGFLPCHYASKAGHIHLDTIASCW